MSNTGSFTWQGKRYTTTSSYDGTKIPTDGHHYYYGASLLDAGFTFNPKNYMTSNITADKYDDCIRLSTLSGGTWSTPSVVLKPAGNLALIADPSVIAFFDGTGHYLYQMWMTGTTDPTGSTGNAVYQATSGDGINWTFHAPVGGNPSPVLPYPGSGWGIGEPFVYWNPAAGGRQAYYSVWYSDNTAGNLKYVTSPDGLYRWSTPVVVPAKGETKSAYLNAYLGFLWDGANGINLVLSSDATTWQTATGANLATSGARPLFPPTGQYPRMIRFEALDTTGQTYGYWFTQGAQSPAFNWYLVRGHATIN